MGKIGSGFEDRVKSIGETTLSSILWKSKAGSMTKADEDVAVLTKLREQALSGNNYPTTGGIEDEKDDKGIKVVFYRGQSQ